MNDVDVSRRAAQKGISATPLSTCYLRPPVRVGLILGYAGVNAHQIYDGVRKLKMSMQGH
jgi:GntR family transcriptional regulator / MocR family aminotransferase